MSTLSDKMKPTSFGEKLANERKRLGMKVAELADKCGINPATQYLYEKGDRHPSSTYLENVFSLGIRPEALFESLQDLGNSPTKSNLRQAFFKVDQECRDAEGRLLDAHPRFERLLEELGFENETAEQKIIGR